MLTRVRTLSFFCFCSIALIAVGCSNGSGSAPGLPQRGGLDRGVSPNTTPVQHIVLMIQENRSFDDFFATYPGADGATTGKTHKGKTIPLQMRNLAALDIDHQYSSFTKDCDLQGSACQMDGFDLATINGNPAPPNYAYQYVNPDQIQPYWTIASQYILADHVFQTQGSGSFTAHQDLIAGATRLNDHESVIDTPSSSKSWGCDAQQGTKTSLITTALKYEQYKGPFPCFTYPTGTLRDLLDAKGVSWRYYSPPHKGNTGGGAIWNAFDAIDAVRNGPEWKTNISVPETNIYGDITNGTLAQMSWVIPSEVDSDHPHKTKGVYTGPQWIASVVNAIGTSQYWNNTTIIIVWDDWGGFYDNEPPPFFDKQGGSGFRVPMLVVSPYVDRGKVNHTVFSFGSILKYVEETFKLGSLNTTDKPAKTMMPMFHYGQQPRPFATIPADRTKAYFLRQPPDYDPVDSE
ncbi:MAG TPA: alkaline phosphatase family protein [Candidatus Tumulicola sp.]|jgi:phospholipase C